MFLKIFHGRIRVCGSFTTNRPHSDCYAKVRAIVFAVGGTHSGRSPRSTSTLSSRPHLLRSQAFLTLPSGAHFITFSAPPTGTKQSPSCEIGINYYRYVPPAFFFEFEVSAPYSIERKPCVLLAHSLSDLYRY